jgi:hypothetical protein
LEKLTSPIRRTLPPRNLRGYSQAPPISSLPFPSLWPGSPQSPLSPPLLSGQAPSISTLPFPSLWPGSLNLHSPLPFSLARLPQSPLSPFLLSGHTMEEAREYSGFPGCRSVHFLHRKLTDFVLWVKLCIIISLKGCRDELSPIKVSQQSTFIESTTVYVPSSELVLPHPLSRKQVCPPPLTFGCG